MTASTTTTTWWHELYDDLLAEMLLVRKDPDELEATARFITEKLELRAGDRVFDQCCGIGNVAIELAASAMHFEVDGVEQSAPYVERGMAAAADRGLAERVHLSCGDARTHAPAKRVHGAFNWYTSFGYSTDDRDNSRMLERAFESLEPGGFFLLDTMNVPGILRSFESETTTRRSTARGEITLLRRSRIDLRAGVMRKRWSYVLPDGNLVEKPETVVRLYMPDALAAMFTAVGFEDVELFGDLRGNTMTIDSPRCIVRARRAAKGVAKNDPR